jgi:DNA replication protein DnaC
MSTGPSKTLCWTCGGIGTIAGSVNSSLDLPPEQFHAELEAARKPCPECGGSSAALLPDSACKLCKGTGWLTAERRGFTGSQLCECQFPKFRKENLGAANIPPLYERASFDSFKTSGLQSLSNVFFLVKEYAESYLQLPDRPGLLLMGQCGTGKTHLAVSALKRMIQMGASGMFVDYHELLDDIMQSFKSDSGESDQDIYSRAKNAEVLVLDDLGSNRSTEWIVDSVTSLLTYRCNHRLITIATTNCLQAPPIDAPKDRTIVDYIGDRGWSRIKEMCTIVDVPYDVADYRCRSVKFR